MCTVKQKTRSRLWPTADSQDTELAATCCRSCACLEKQSLRWYLSVEKLLSFWNCQILFIKIRAARFGECAAFWMWQVRTSATDGRQLSFRLALLKCTKELRIAVDSLHLHLGCEPLSPSAQAPILLIERIVWRNCTALRHSSIVLEGKRSCGNPGL